jgi:hypothetical protein
MVIAPSFTARFARKADARLFPAQARVNLVGGDGLEPPTLSV